jgi:hypothetical protein
VLPNDGMNEGGVIGDTTDIHFTTLCFTSGTGAPVMCAVILKSEKELAKLPLNVKLGINVLKKINTSENSSLAQIIENNTDDDSSMCGGPVCRFNGVEVPCFVCCTKKASSTSELLMEKLKTIGSYKLFDLSDGSLPFYYLMAIKVGQGYHS